MSEDSNGSGPEQPSGPTQEMMQQMLEASALQIANLLVDLAPHLTDEQAIDIATKCAAEQMGPIPRNVLPTILDRDACRKYPTFFASIKRMGKEGDEALGAVVKAPKRLDDIHDPGQAVQSVMILALIMTPVARAVLRAHGWDVVFGQSQEAPAGRIVLSS